VVRDLLGSPRSFLLSIIDSESTSHVSEAHIDLLFVQLPETESDCNQSDHMMEFHLDVQVAPCLRVGIVRSHQY
jgi:hypothetical protein